MKFFILAVPFLLCFTAMGEEKPSFLLFFVDDLGYRDVGAYHPESFYETPHIDALAKSGLKFTDGYAANPVCSPSRFAIQTGRYPTRKACTNFFGGNRGGKFRPAAVYNRLDHDEVTIAEALKAQGYATFYAGKWHLGPSEEFWPENHGYDVNKGGFDKGGPYGGDKYFSPYGNPRLSDGPVGEHLPDRLAAETCDFIEAHRNEPFFAMLAFYSVHTPLIGRPDLVKKYEEKARGIIGEEFGEEEKVHAGAKEQRVRILQKHATYAAMVEAMDEAVGKVLAKLDELGLADEVVVAFTSDNGGLSTSEGWPTSNLPLRGGKGWVYEGGIREPLLLRWPGLTKPGSVSSVPVMNFDLTPTFVAAAGGDLAEMVDPEGESRETERKIDGVNLLPLLKGEAFERGPLYWHYPHYSNQGGFPGGAIRVGDWKLIERYEDGRVHLFNLKDDIGERSDLSGEHPERVAAMRASLHRWYQETDAKFLQPKNGLEPWQPVNGS